MNIWIQIVLRHLNLQQEMFDHVKAVGKYLGVSTLGIVQRLMVVRIERERER